MKPISLLFLHLLCFCIFFSCGEKEEPSGESGKITITGLTLAAPSDPNAKTAAEYEWKHAFDENLTLDFNNSITSEHYSLQLDPNDFSKPYSKELPFGTYRISTQSPASSPSPNLPLTIDTQFTLSPNSTSLVLEGSSDFGLVSFSGSKIRNIRSGLETEPFNFQEKDGIYYSYFQQGDLAKIEVKLENGKVFHQLVKPETFNQYHFDILAPEEESTSIHSTSFGLTEYAYPLAADKLPGFLSPATLAQLPEAGSESSGLAYIQGRLFTINDGGNSNEILEIDPDNGELIRKVKVENADNIDWEDLAQSPTHLFIGDFGNNTGTRKNLAVHRIALSDLLESETVQAETISFGFSDQADFTSSPNHTAYDCEAMVYWNDNLYLFTKNWVTGNSGFYRLKDQAEPQEATLLGTLDVQGLLTGADVDQFGNLVLLGYEQSGLQSNSFLWILPKIGQSDLTLNGGKKLFMGSPARLSQTEGVVFVNEKELLIAGEKISFGPATIPGLLHAIELTGFID